MVSLLIFLLIGLSTSSFFLNDYLTKTINKNKHNLAQLNFALEHNNLAALRFAWENSQFHSKQWLNLAKKLAKTQGKVAYQLANYYQDKLEPEPEQVIFWYKSAIRLKYFPASITLAQHYFEQEQLDKAAKILAALPAELSEKLSIEANILKVNIAINQGKLAEVKQVIGHYASQLKTTPTGRLLLTDIKKYQLLSNTIRVNASEWVIEHCDNSIQFFATNLNHLKHLESLIKEVKGQALGQFVCFLPVLYLPINALDCIMEQEQAIRCDERNWQQWLNKINTRYIGLMLPKGGANVHLGILYFDAQDNADVITHEISHLLGFIDEYPLVTGHVKCRSSQSELFSHNISVLQRHYQGEQTAVRSLVMKQIAWAKQIKTTTPILQPVSNLKDKQYWQLGTPEAYQDEVGLFKAQTCQQSVKPEKNSFGAYKAVSQRTKLQYFALDFPSLYAKLLQENPKQYLMPSFHYNIALAYFQQSSFQQSNSQQGNIEQANYWLEQAAKWEQDDNRRKKVRQGKF